MSTNFKPNFEQILIFIQELTGIRERKIGREQTQIASLLAGQTYRGNEEEGGSKIGFDGLFESPDVAGVVMCLKCYIPR